MKLNNLKTLTAGVAVIALLLGSCSKQAKLSLDDKLVNAGASVSKRSGAASLLSTCENCPTYASIRDTATGSAPFSVYCKWIPGKLDTLVDNCSNVGPVIRFEGIYSSFVRPVSTGWYVGVVDPEYGACNVSWASTYPNVLVKNSPTYLGTDPSSCASNYNVVGYNGSLSGYVFGLGYYSYSPPIANQTIVIWKDEIATDPTQETSPADAVEAWVVNITSLGGSGGTSYVQYNFHKKL